MKEHTTKIASRAGYQNITGWIIMHLLSIYSLNCVMKCINGLKVSIISLSISSNSTNYNSHFILQYVADPENVVTIHCNSGKGWAGTACTSLLLYLGYYDNVLDCAKLFGLRRFTDHKGISQPCQVRFIHYFESFYTGIVKSPSVKILKKITIITVPDNGCKPYF